MQIILHVPYKYYITYYYINIIPYVALMASQNIVKLKIDMGAYSKVNYLEFVEEKESVLNKYYCYDCPRIVH
jgi:hypothetical protein